MKDIFALVDCNNFFASCETVFNPSLSGKPVVVLSSNDGCIVSRSRRAKALGIPMGAPAFEYKDFIKKHKFYVYSANFALYGDMSDRVMKTLAQFAPDLEIYSIDEAFLSLKGIKADLTAYGAKIRQTLKKWTGIPVSVGIGPTKTLAKIANEKAKKDPELSGVLNITDHPQIDNLLSTIDVADVWGIGRQYAKFLKSHNIDNALELKNASDGWIKKNLTVAGLRTVWELRGIACIHLETAPAPKKGIISSRSFGYPVEKLHEVKEAVATYISRAAEKLRAQNSVCSYLTVFISTKHFGCQPHYFNSQGAILTPPTDDTTQLASNALRLVAKIFKPGFKYRKVGVILSGITAKNLLQLDLFGKNQAKSKNLMKTLDGINAKLGSDTVFLAAEGIFRSWQAKQARKSQRFTTQWRELPLVR